MNNKPNLNKWEKSAKLLVDKTAEIVLFSIFAIIGSSPITIPYFLESQVKPNVSVNEPVITIQDPKNPQVSIHKSVIPIPKKQ